MHVPAYPHGEDSIHVQATSTIVIEVTVFSKSREVERRDSIKEGLREERKEIYEKGKTYTALYRLVLGMKRFRMKSWQASRSTAFDEFTSGLV